MAQLRFIDCNCSFGKRKVVAPGSFVSRGRLLNYMQLYGIEEAFVYHSYAEEYRPKIGNAVLMREIENTDNLSPVWVVMPHYTGEFAEPEALTEQMKKQGVKIVRMFPDEQQHGYSLSSWNCGELFSILSSYKIPVILGKKGTSFDEIYYLCKNYPELRIILTQLTYRMDRNLYPLLEQLPNLYLETSGYKGHRGIEHICHYFGANRLIFGTDMPVGSGASAVTTINYAEISLEEKQVIAAGNLVKLLSEVCL